LNEINYNINKIAFSNDESTLINEVYEMTTVEYFFGAHGGTGKTFLLNLLLAKVRNDKNMALAVAF